MHLDPDPIEGFVMPPDVGEIDRAVAIICGSNPIMALDEEALRDFENFVREVLATTVGRDQQAIMRVNNTLRDTLLVIKSLCEGDRIPRWKDDWATAHTRGQIMGLIDRVVR